MATHKARIVWERLTEEFSYKSYNREHEWYFAGGVVVPASAAPDYLGKPDHVDPEQAFVASLSACHMLTFLFLASKQNFVVERYEDDAEGTLGKNETGKMWMQEVVLRPRVTFANPEQVDPDIFDQMHHQAHEGCFIANSVLTRIDVEPEVLR